jgi:hypothetical protein
VNTKQRYLFKKIKIEHKQPLFLVSIKMEKLYTTTRFRVVNGWLEVENSDDNFNTRSITRIKLERISHLTREGPFGDYDSNNECITVWNVYINTIRASEGRFIRHVIGFVFKNEGEAETFLMGVNNQLY